MCLGMNFSVLTLGFTQLLTFVGFAMVLCLYYF
jgi:hypothetical protein